jgi:hypothetical protein
MDWIRLIWDFHGPHAEGTAKHHAIHLDEFAKKEGIESQGHGSESVSKTHFIAYLIVQRKHMTIVRDALRPARATLEH